MAGDFRTVTIVGFILFGLVVTAFFAAAITIWRRQRGSASARGLDPDRNLVAVRGIDRVGRLQVTLQAAFMWRYVTLLMPAVCGLALAAEGWIISRGNRCRLGFAVGWLLLAGVVWSDFKPEDNAAIMAKGKNLWVATYLRTRDLNAANQAARFSIYSLDPASPVIAGRLRWLDQRHLSFFRVPPDKK